MSASNNDKTTSSDRPERLPYRDQPVPDVAKKILESIRRTNNPPTIFQQSGRLVRLRRIDDEWSVDPITLDVARHFIARAINFVWNNRKDGPGEVCPPPIDYVRDFLAAPEWDTKIIPALEGVVQAPYFTKAGRLIVEPGYDSESRLYFAPHPSFSLRSQWSQVTPLKTKFWKPRGSFSTNSSSIFLS